MDRRERFEAMLAERAFLQTEMELNRRYIFERPLLIVAGGITAAATLAEMVGFHFVPILFVALMGFNLWFTYNRIQSNGRIISYLQVIHTPNGDRLWFGWEAALDEFRKRKAATPQQPVEREPQPEFGFYGPIFAFHQVSVVLLTAFLLAQVEWRSDETQIATPALVVLGLTGVALVVFFVLCWRLRPDNVRPTIGRTRAIWKAVFADKRRKAPRAAS
jgi:hypothetical protein